MILAAIVIGILDWVVAKVARWMPPLRKGIIGFAVAAIILYVTGLIVDGFNVGVSAPSSVPDSWRCGCTHARHETM